MHLYVESSAVLSWLLREPASPRVEEILKNAETCTSSKLMLVEWDRAIHRAVALKNMSESVAADLRTRLANVTRDWTILRFSPAIVARVREPFPEEPIRTLDALHVASALHARTAIPDLAILGLDTRVRRVAESLGFAVVPG